MRPPAADGFSLLECSSIANSDDGSDGESPCSSSHSHRTITRRLFPEDTPQLKLCHSRNPSTSLCSTPTGSGAQTPVVSTCPFFLADIPNSSTLSSSRSEAQQGHTPSPTASCSSSSTVRQAGVVTLRSQSERAPGLARSRSLGYTVQESADYGQEVTVQPLEPISLQGDTIRTSLLRSNTMPPIQSMEVAVGGAGGGGGGGGFIRLPALNALMKIFAALLVVAVTVAAMIFGKEPMNDLLMWLERHNNPRGMAIFVAIEAACVTLLIPAVPLIIGAGLVFGFAKGLLVVWAGGAIGQMGAFLLARYILRDCMVHVMQKRFQGWDALDKAIQIEGWKLIMLLRISPLVPYNVLNVMLGSSGITFKTFAFFSTVGIVPECMITVYFGTLAGNIANVINGNAGPEGPMKLIMIVSGGVMMVLAALYAGYVTKKAIRRAVARAEVVQDIESMQPLSPLADTGRVMCEDEFEPLESSTASMPSDSAHQRRVDAGHQAQQPGKQSNGGSSMGSSSAPRTQTALRSSIFGGMPGMPMVSPVIVSSQEAEKRL